MIYRMQVFRFYECTYLKKCIKKNYRKYVLNRKHSRLRYYGENVTNFTGAIVLSCRKQFNFFVLHFAYLREATVIKES